MSCWVPGSRDLQLFLTSACGGQAAGMSWLKYEVFREDVCIKDLVSSSGTIGGSGVFGRWGPNRGSKWASVPWGKSCPKNHLYSQLCFLAATG